MTGFSFPEKGSRVLREFNERRQLERAIAARGAVPAKRSFAGAAVSRLTASLEMWSGSVNADLDAGLAILRARARALCANSDFGRRFLSLVASNVVGPAGPTLQVRALMKDGKLDKAANDAIEVHWKRWTERADLGGRMTLARLLQVAVKGAARDGEALIRVVRNSALPYGIQLQLLEADRLDEALNVTLPSGARIRQGVELDTAGRAVAYYLMVAHPGENYAGAGRKHERVLARDLYHVFLPERAEQVRGYTWLHAVLVRAHMLHGFEEAAVVAARVGASKMGVWEKDPEAASAADTLADAGTDSSGNLQMSAEPGEFIEAPNGYKLNAWNPSYPHENFESFLKACLRALSAGLNVANHNLTGDMSGVNYSSARIAELAEREVWVELQEWLIASVLKSLFRDWLQSALVRGDVTFEASGKSLPADKLSKFADVARFQGRRWNWVDPKNDAEASELLIRTGLASRTSIAASQGREFEDIIDELKQERELMLAAGLVETAPATPAPAQADPEEPSVDQGAATKAWSELISLLADSASLKSSAKALNGAVGASSGAAGATAEKPAKLPEAISSEGSQEAAAIPEDAARTTLLGVASEDSPSSKEKALAVAALFGDAGATAELFALQLDRRSAREKPQAADASGNGGWTILPADGSGPLLSLSEPPQEAVAAREERPGGAAGVIVDVKL